MSYLILGCGFIGLPLAKALASNTHENIYIISRSKVASSLSGNIKFIIGNAFDSQQYLDILPKVHTLIYLLPSGSPIDRLEDPVSIIASFNVLLNNCQKYKVWRFIFASSVSIYGECLKQSPATELSPRLPISLHAEIKTIQERLLLARSSKDFKPIIFRISNPYGIDQRYNLSQGVVGIMLNSFISSIPITLRENGEHIRDFIFIEDVVNCIILLLDCRSKDDSIINICYGQSFSIAEVYNIMSKCFGSSPAIYNSPSHEYEIRNSYVSNSFLLQRLPSISGSLTPLEEGISNLCSRFV